ncbi:MAG: hypothetical protein CL693_16820 [Cellvibrionaceae bacterium]|nr:hypothetical protein [Cellvibrionaceae bacterium]
MELVYSIVRLVCVLAGLLIGLYIGYSGWVSDVEGAFVSHSMVFLPLMVISLWGARSCLEDSGDPITAVGYPVIYTAVAWGANQFAGSPLPWLIL